MKRIGIILFAFIALSVDGISQANKQDEQAKFITNISQYIRWSNLDKLGKTFTIGVVRNSEMAKLLIDKFERRTILGKKVKIIEFYKLDDIEKCEVLYLSRKVFVNDNTLNYITNKVDNHSTLIISDDAKRIAMVNFYVRSSDNILCFEINKTNIENSGLIIQRSLLKHKNTTKIE